MMPEMKCPDSSHPLKEVRRHGVAIDQCPYCGGVWFDAGELDAVRSANPQMKPAGEEARFEKLADHPARCCPSCLGANLDAGMLAGHRVDRCGACGGLWVSGAPAIATGRGTGSALDRPESLGAAADAAFLVAELALDLLDLFD